MEWLENDKAQNRTQFDGEVIISVERGERLLFKFRKNSVYKIISNEEYVVIAKDGNKIYFREATPNRGFKLGNWTPNVKCFKVLLSKFPLREEDLGEYNLEFDTNLGLHYICLNRKLEKQLNWEGR